MVSKSAARDRPAAEDRGDVAQRPTEHLDAAGRRRDRARDGVGLDAGDLAHLGQRRDGRGELRPMSELLALPVLGDADRGQAGALDDRRLAIVATIDEEADPQCSGLVQELPCQPDGLLDLRTHPRAG